MTDQNETDGSVDPAPDAEHRAAWVTPLIYRIDAGEAEVGTRMTAADGMFTTS